VTTILPIVATKRLKRPRDPIQLGKLIVDIATGHVEDVVEDKRNPAAVELGRKGGLKGGKARAANLSDTPSLLPRIKLYCRTALFIAYKFDKA
jgi:hypothetical protein